MNIDAYTLCIQTDSDKYYHFHYFSFRDFFAYTQFVSFLYSNEYEILKKLDDSLCEMYEGEYCDALGKSLRYWFWEAEELNNVLADLFPKPDENYQPPGVKIDNTKVD